MQLTKAIIESSSSSALQMVKTLLDNPMIISLTAPQFGFPLEVETYDKGGQAEVSQRPVIVPGKGVKKILNDNVAPQPVTWQLSGYIPGSPLIEKTCLFTPIVMANLVFLWIAYERGARLVYKDMDQRVYTNCVIESLHTGNVKDCKNKMPFSMTLKQIVTIDASEAELTETEQNAQPEGSPESLGTQSTKKVQDGDLYEPLGGDKAASKVVSFK